MTTIELDKELVIQRYKNGASTPTIAKDYNINPGLVYYYLKKWGAKPRTIQKFPSVDDNKDKILEMFNNGLSCYKIGLELDIPKPNILRFLKKLGVDTSAKSTQREDGLGKYSHNIVDMYLSGLSENKIAKHFNAVQSSISRILSAEGISTRPKAIYEANETYFNSIDTEYKAYILGWLYADGNVMDDRWRIQIQQSDSYMLEWIANQVKYTGPLYQIPPPVKFPHRKWQTCLSVCRKKMADDIVSLGCTKHKSLTIEFPTDQQVPPSLLNHFLRGVFDGDGSISIKGNALNCSVVCSPAFAEGFGKAIQWEYNTYNKKKSKQIMFTKTEHAFSFLSYLYNNSNIHLNRKHEIFKSWQ